MATKTTKRALFLSVISLFICFTMLIGTTYAWFTDSVTSTGNIIKTGTLDVTLEYKTPKDSDWIDASTGAIFDHDNWEPGYAEVRYVKIENEGSLDLKFVLNIIPETEPAAGEPNLADVIDVYMLDGEVPVTRDELASATPVGTLASLIADPDGAAYGVLYDKDEAKADSEGKKHYVETYTLVLKMQETAGNEYQDKTVGGTFAVQLLATQLASEIDDVKTPDYDAEATYPEVSVPADLPTSGSTAEDIPLKTDNADLTLPADLASDIAEQLGAKKVSAVHATPDVDVDAKKVTIKNFELVDENGKVIDLATMNNDKPITVTLSVGDAFAVGETIVIYHDEEAVANAVVFDDNGVKKVTYTATHFCDIVASMGDGKIDSTVELEAGLVAGGDINVEGEIDFDKLNVYTPWGSDYTYEMMIDGDVVSSINGGSYTLDQSAKYGLFIANDSDMSLSNMTIKTNSQWSIYAYNIGTLTLSNVEIVAEKGAGFYPYYGGTTILNDVKVNHQALDESYATSTPWAATAVAVSNGQDMIINSGTYVGATYALYVYSSGANVVINGGTFKAPVVVAADAQNGANAYVTINGGNFDGKFESVNVWGGSEALITINGGNFTNFSTTANKRITINGGTFDADPTQWVADECQVVDNGDGTYSVFKGVVVSTTDELVAAINAGATKVYLNSGDYALRFTNNTNFNVDGMTLKGLGDVKLAISSSEAWYGRVQGSNVTFENIHFISTVGATGKATYNNCTFDNWTICASSNKEETYFNKCAINGCLNTSTDFSSGDVYVKNCTVVKAEYSGSMTVNFESCEIGEVIICNSNTNFTNCDVTTMNLDNVSTATVMIDGVVAK